MQPQASSRVAGKLPTSNGAISISCLCAWHRHSCSDVTPIPCTANAVECDCVLLTQNRSTSKQPGQLGQQQTPLSSALEPRDWSVQAAAVTDGLCDASKYKSLAVYAEVKLAEALDKAAKTAPDAVDEDGQLPPNSLKTAVCCQVGTTEVRVKLTSTSSKMTQCMAHGTWREVAACPCQTK